jgi:hypothetical protein
VARLQRRANSGSAAERATRDVTERRQNGRWLRIAEPAIGASGAYPSPTSSRCISKLQNSRSAAYRRSWLAVPITRCRSRTSPSALTRGLPSARCRPISALMASMRVNTSVQWVTLSRSSATRQHGQQPVAADAVEPPGGGGPEPLLAGQPAGPAGPCRVRARRHRQRAARVAAQELTSGLNSRLRSSDLRGFARWEQAGNAQR